jgi:hypothetical protein
MAIKRFASAMKDSLDIRDVLGMQAGKVVAYILLVVLSVGAALTISNTGVMIGGVFLILAIGLPIVFACLLYPRFGLLLALTASYFITYVKRITFMYEAPYGLVMEVAVYVTVLGVLFRAAFKKDLSLGNFTNSISIVFIIWLVYNLGIQLFNPYTHSLAGWFLTVRGTMMYLMIYFIALYCFKDIKYIKLFTIVWLVLALLCALYGLYQEYVGMPGYDLRWVYSSRARFRLNFIWGRFRKWSFLSDSMTFGVFMAFAAIFCLILFLGPNKLKRRIFLGISTVLLFLGMAYSGTRTAYAIVPVGIVLFILMTINNYKTLIFALMSFLVFAFLIFGPVQNPILNRFRSAFDEDDPSLQVRENNRDYIQPYIWSHAMGGGLLTTGDTGLKYYPDHELSGFATDSGFLKTALETGWIGLIIQIALYFSALVYGLSGFYKCRDPEIRTLYAAYICAFFAVTIANFAQVASSKYPVGILIFCIYAIFIHLNKISSERPQKEAKS